MVVRENLTSPCDSLSLSKSMGGRVERWREGFGSVILDSAQDLVPGGPFQPCVLLSKGSGDPPRGTVQGQLGRWPGGAWPLLPPYNSISSLPAETNSGWGEGSHKENNWKK